MTLIELICTGKEMRVFRVLRTLIIPRFMPHLLLAITSRNAACCVRLIKSISSVLWTQRKCSRKNIAVLSHKDYNIPI